MTENNPAESQTFDTQQLYKSILEFVESLQFEESHRPGIVAFILNDGTFKFSLASPIFVTHDILEESHLSDRLLVIVSVAYLEDQMRLLLASWLANDDETDKLLDPESGTLPFLSLARLAFSSGLIAKEWFEIMREMANLRNKFAHKPAAQSFEELRREDKKRTEKSLGRLFELYNQLSSRDWNMNDENIHGKFAMVFQQMYTYLQFSLDHLAGENSVQAFTSDQIVGIHHFSGFTKADLQSLADQGFDKF